MIKTLFRKKKHFFLAGLTLKFTFLIFFSLPYILQQVQSIERRDEIKASVGLLQNHNIQAILPEKIPDDDKKAETEVRKPKSTSIAVDHHLKYFFYY
jgi:hypothetical protein